jgi:hypothetical protein
MHQVRFTGTKKVTTIKIKIKEKLASWLQNVPKRKVLYINRFVLLNISNMNI